MLFNFFPQRYDSKAYAPKFPKPKDEGWFLIVGEVESKELVALKRVPYVRGDLFFCIVYLLSYFYLFN